MDATIATNSHQISPVLGYRVSIVIPAYNEGVAVLPVLARIDESVGLPHEILVIVDTADDETATVIGAQKATQGQVRVAVNDYGPGPANATRYGIDHASAPVVVVTMADGSDDPRLIDDLVRLVDRGVVVAAASRYMPGGQLVGAPLLKRTLSRLAGRSCTCSPASAPVTRPTPSRRTRRASYAKSASTAATASRSGSS